MSTPITSQDLPTLRANALAAMHNAVAMDWAAAEFRFSTVKQATTGTTLDNQRAALSDLCFRLISAKREACEREALRCLLALYPDEAPAHA